MAKQKLNILYARLSREDGEDSVSNSIVNQQQLLTDYAERHSLTPYRFIQDDGVSGTIWNRPSWQELMGEVEAGRVATIVVKNLDRLGRAYLQVGMYSEVLFREKGVRFIAVNDNVDSAKGDDDFVPFRNIINQWYARDTSRKVAASYRAKGNDGKHTGNRKNNTFDDPYRWWGTSVCYLLERMEYMRHTCSFKTYKNSYRDKHRRPADKADWKITENTHKAIIDPETWEAAQHCHKTARRIPKQADRQEKMPNRLTGLVFCSDCNAKMYHDYCKDAYHKHPRDTYLSTLLVW